MAIEVVFVGLVVELAEGLSEQEVEYYFAVVFYFLNFGQPLRLLSIFEFKMSKCPTICSFSERW